MSFVSLRCLLLLLLVMLFVGCGDTKPDPSTGAEENSTADAGGGEDEHNHEKPGHSHAGDDELFWLRDGLEKGEYSIKLGHHGVHVLEGHAVEPAVAITRDGKPVADAKVFMSLASGDGETVLVEEKQTVYEPVTEHEEAHYAQAKLDVPHEVKKVFIRYRIVLAGDGGEEKIAVPVPVEAH